MFKEPSPLHQAVTSVLMPLVVFGLFQFLIAAESANLRGVPDWILKPTQLAFLLFRLFIWIPLGVAIALAILRGMSALRRVREAPVERRRLISFLAVLGITLGVAGMVYLSYLIRTFIFS